MIPESSYELIHLHVVLSLHSTHLNYFPFPSAIFSPPTFSQLHSPQQELPQLRFPWTGPLHTTQSALPVLQRERGAVETKNRGAGRGRKTEGETERGGTEWRKSDREPGRGRQTGDRTIVKSGHRGS